MTAHYELWDVEVNQLIATAKTQDLLLTAFLDAVRKQDSLFLRGYYVTTDNVRTYLFRGDELDQWREDYETSRYVLQVNYQLSDVGLRDYLEQNGFLIEIDAEIDAHEYFNLYRYVATVRDSQNKQCTETGATIAEAVLRSYLSYAFWFHESGWKNLKTRKEVIDEKHNHESNSICRENDQLSPEFWSG